MLGNYCYGCGQRIVQRRLSLAEILWEFPGKVFSLERGLWLTFLALLVRPGQVCLDYVHGRRQIYVNPVSYFLIAASVQLASLWFTAPIVRQSVSQSLSAGRQNPAQAAAFERMDKILGGDSGAAMADVYLTVIVQAYTYLAVIAFAVPLALALWVFHRRCHYHFAELMVFSLYVTAQCLIVTAFTTPIFSRLGTVAQMLTAQGFYIFMAVWAHGRFFPPGVGRRFLTLSAMMFAMGCFFISIIMLFTLSWASYLIWLESRNIN
ncbi:MAG: DUF3667 domain-containing protein [Planctomycetaceae bacterium]|nr:DUF3667 domain-containing protein [Planctomycetaceae bacterium]